MELTGDKAKAWLLNFEAKIQEHKAYLSDLDQAIGDGDHGSNMARGTEAVKVNLEKIAEPETAEVLKQAAMALISKVGGASGPLYGSAFMQMAKTAKETTDIHELIEAGLEGIKHRGKADVGDKTMVDTWAPVVEALAKDALTNEAITQAVDATKPLKAKKGRASYVGERSIGALDPGAVSSGYLFTALVEEVLQ
ncbi:dihydroxyacetone kinase subunit L [Halolactibacillus alkaliphilus]|uniref:phosphoenolpyruvate--glycerone phosphotransferase n=1 Tax=Halolactibacillus alkaliphilus TaxID=442899 RepID=A0A511WZI6_9BACI|nr:dihydroxyacetone kinase subunit DhaL [Halolactibacillus alkaliphilus]GEN56098.1 dihydroxyacetone kinase subunit L [Halolactibacillus alkaliphilus]GGN67218.1 dihydroxyacetone kinase subunit L [Halolactibacillus alkaliphilus]SFO71363.1 dihydroxyacetone kinase DhaL subunit [Halolactibacillus alkaliphilus]